MTNYVTVTLDTTAPSNPSININGGAVYATMQSVTCAIGTSDSDVTGYQMKVWGDVDVANDANVQTTEGASAWIAYSVSKVIKLSTGDALKTIYLKIRDDVNNESSITNDTITLNTAIPTVNVGSPDVPKVSKIAGKNSVSFTISSGTSFDEYKVKVVSATGADNTTGVLVGTANGSTNTSGVAGNYTTPITVTIKGADLELASSGDGAKIIKVFIKNSAGTWSV